MLDAATRPPCGCLPVVEKSCPSGCATVFISLLGGGLAEVDASAIYFHMVEARKGGIEFLAGIVGKAGAEARDEAVFASPPLAVDVDRIIEGGGADLRQEAGFQGFSDEARARRD